MVKISDLIDDFAERFNVPPATVRGVARYLRQADQLTTGARGVNAPDATPLDAARLLLALMVRSTSLKAPEETSEWAAFPLIFMDGGGKAHLHQGFSNLEQAIAFVFDLCSRHAFPWNNTVDLQLFLNERYANIVYRSFDEDDTELNRELYQFGKPVAVKGFHQQAYVSSQDLEQIGALFFEGASDD